MYKIIFDVAESNADGAPDYSFQAEMPRYRSHTQAICIKISLTLFTKQTRQPCQITCRSHKQRMLVLADSHLFIPPTSQQHDG